MQLIVDGEARVFIPVQKFRTTHDLPPVFGVGYFAPKEYAGLGNVEQAGADLNLVRNLICDAVPAAPPPEGWTAFIFTLQREFAAQLAAINAQLGLRPSEIEFAVTGFGDALRTYIFRYGQARMRLKPPPDFDTVYQRWYEQNLDVSARWTPYNHCGETWRVQIVASVYGRIGLVVTRRQGVDYVHDPSLACPVAGYMTGLLRDVAARIYTSLERQGKEESHASSSE